MDLNRVRQRCAWEAISNLFLDTDTNLLLDYMASKLRESQFSPEILTEMYESEVAPALFWDWHIIAGEWLGFDEDWLEQAILRQRPYTSHIFKTPCLGPLVKLFYTLPTRRQWQVVLKHLQQSS